MSIELTNKTVTCRKSHLCEWCGEVIEKGDQAQYRSGVHEGDFFSGHQHIECYEAMTNSDYDDFDYGGFDPMCQKRGKTMGESHE
jgi:hypothetical protein